MKGRQLLLLPAFALVAALGYWLAGTAAPPRAARERSAVPEPPPRKVIADDPMPKFRGAERPPRTDRDMAAHVAGAFEGQRVLVFKDQAALAAFLARAGDRIRVLGRLDALNALRVGFSAYDDLASLLEGEEEESMIFPVSAPAPPEGTVQPGALALGDRLLEWLASAETIRTGGMV